MKFRTLLLLGIFIASSLTLQAKVIIWDLGGVLFEENRFTIGKRVGFSHFFGRIFFDWKSPDIEPIVFDVLDMMPCPQVPDNIFACTKKGTPLPAILCHWQSGTISGKELARQAVPHIEQLEQAGYFISNRERQLIEKAICTLCDPEAIASSMSRIDRGIQILSDCYHEVDAQGSPKNRLIALSNWDPHSFDLLHDLHTDVFEHFEALVISGKTGLIKPHVKAYSYLIDTYSLNPDDCLVIDDQEINLLAAEKLGFNTFHLSKSNFRELRQVLKEFGALS